MPRERRLAGPPNQSCRVRLTVGHGRACLFLRRDLLRSGLEGELLDLDPAERVDRFRVVVDRRGKPPLNDAVNEVVERSVCRGCFDTVDHRSADRLLLALVGGFGGERDRLDLDPVAVGRQRGHVCLNLGRAATNETPHVITGQLVANKLGVGRVGGNLGQPEGEFRVVLARVVAEVAECRLDCPAEQLLRLVGRGHPQVRAVELFGCLYVVPVFLLFLSGD